MMKIYDVNVPTSGFKHRVVTDNGAVVDPDTKTKLHHNFLDYRRFKDQPFEDFAEHMRGHYHDFECNEVPVHEAGKPFAKPVEDERKQGIMVAFFVPDSVSSKLAIHGLEPAKHLHVTLCCLGKPGEVAEDAVSKIKEVLGTFASSHAKIGGSVSGIGRFNASPESSDGKEAVYASYSSPELNSFRQDLVAALHAAGVKIDATFGYTPHITLGYVRAGEPNPANHIPTTTIEFDEVTLMVAGVETKYALKGIHNPKI